jgi:hypothetical protein
MRDATCVVPRGTYTVMTMVRTHDQEDIRKASIQKSVLSVSVWGMSFHRSTNQTNRQKSHKTTKSQQTQTHKEC